MTTKKTKSKTKTSSGDKLSKLFGEISTEIENGEYLAIDDNSLTISHGAKEWGLLPKRRSNLWEPPQLYPQPPPFLPDFHEEEDWEIDPDVMERLRKQMNRECFFCKEKIEDRKDEVRMQFGSEYIFLHKRCFMDPEAQRRLRALIVTEELDLL